jgi:hypothetical protein
MEAIAAKWRELCQEALLETGTAELEQKMQSAEGAVFLRLQELWKQDPDNPEREDLRGALSTLRKLQIERLGYPAAPGEGWPSGQPISRWTTKSV